MFTQAITPAIKSHMEVQLAFLTDLSRKAFDTAQRVSELNLRLTQELLEEMTSANHQMMTARDAGEFASAASTQLHPAMEKLRSYQQRLFNLMASANADITKTAEFHIPEASRTATAVADEMLRAASEESEKATQRQRAALDRMSEAAQRGNGMGQHPGQLQGQGMGQGQQAH
ncbi:phasin family protein [Janthinobacterium fluminis]|uniref:Phasin family protein n=1 Tax=Janthinobacterium fluminis TaxID=2987524 RepID=A0ABT5K5F5_9BURK|nr:phasin family protein [Janthinobacterium fluminis]MDC8760124.1 phasin family protein [Janthinobacterium fluminis]